MSENQNYPTALDEKMSLFFDVLNEKKTQVDRLKNSNSDLWKTILFKLKVDWTYHSTSIEGSTFTKGDTVFFLNPSSEQFPQKFQF